MGTVKVKTRSGRPRKIERTASRIVRKASQNPYFTARDLQEDLADTGVVVHCSTVQQHLHKYGLHGTVIRRKPLMCPNHKIQRLNFAKEHLDKPDLFWKQVPWTNEVKIELIGWKDQRYVWRTKATEFHEKTVQLLSIRVDLLCFWVVLQPVAQYFTDSIKFQQILKANIRPSLKKLNLKRMASTNG